MPRCWSRRTHAGSTPWSRMRINASIVIPCSQRAIARTHWVHAEPRAHERVVGEVPAAERREPADVFRIHP